MKYELTIRCLECGITRSFGGFESLPDLSDVEVWEEAIANPGCPVTQENVSIERTQQTEGDTVIAVTTLVSTAKWIEY